MPGPQNVPEFEFPRQFYIYEKNHLNLSRINFHINLQFVARSALKTYFLFQHLEQALLLGTRGAFIHECREHGMTPGNSNGKRRSSVSNASGVFEKLKTSVFKAFDDVDMDTFFEVSTFMS